jgi:hypothetical protein
MGKAKSYSRGEVPCVDSDSPNLARQDLAKLVVQPKRMVPIRFEKLLHKINMIVD